MISKFLLYISATAFLAIIYLNPASTIRCWTCRSDVDPGCADPFDNRSLPIVDCSAKKLKHIEKIAPVATMCRKTRQKVEGEWRYIRSCAWLGEAGKDGDERICNYTMGTYNIFVEHCNCKSKDGCNDASSASAPLLCLLLTTIFRVLV